MNGKNLPLKFGFLALIVAAGIVSLTTKGLREGIDLRGGAELVYRIQPSEDGTPADSDLARRMINVLKRRVDPGGLMNLEWRPIGKDRLSIRMPAPREESQKARTAYADALATLDERNLRVSQIHAVAAKPEGSGRDEAIAELAGGDERLAKDLAALAKVQDELSKALQGTDDNARAEARVKWRKDLRDFRATHDLRTAEMESVLQRYAAAQGLADKKAAAQRLEEYTKALASLQGRFPGRKAQIDEVVAKHKDWLTKRQHLEDPADLKRLISRAGQLEFRIAPGVPGAKAALMPISKADYDKYRNDLQDEGPEAGRRRNDVLQWFPANGKASDYGPVVTSQYAGQLYILLSTQPGNTMLQSRAKKDWALKRSYPTSDNMGLPAVGFEFDPRGAKLFATLTQTHKGHFMAVLLDDTIYSCPTIRETISDRGIISGSFTGQEVNELVRILEAGSLPARLDPVPVSESKFGPALGKVNREYGKMAGIAGLIAVAIFMLVYYGLSGSIADVALVLNIVLVLGVMSMFDVVLTLPGIAGVILTVGIAVDANVLIFERLREEQSRGQAVSVAIKNAYDRALSAIFDANITTLITCLILGWVSTEEVKGFAITLGLGVAFSLFTALVVTKWVFQVLVRTGIVAKPVFMLHIIGVPKINWMAKRRWFWALSAVMIAAGIAAFVGQGKDVLGIEFSAGTKAQIELKDGEFIEDGRFPDDGLIRSRFVAAAEQLGLDKLKATARVELVVDPDRAERFVETYDADSDGKVASAELPKTPYFEKLVDLIDENGDAVLDAGELAELPPLKYQVTTTESRIVKVREAAEKAFGSALRRRLACAYDVIKGDLVAGLGIPAAPEDGLTLIRSIGSGAAATLENFDGGLMIAVRNLTPALQVGEIEDRVRQMRFQEDFAAQRQNTSKIVPLELGADGKCGSFALLVRHSSGEVLDETSWKSFAEGENELLDKAMRRSESTDAVNFDPAIAGETAQSAIVAVILSWLAIVGYLWFRFGSPQWGAAAVVCLVHDVIIVLGLVAISNTVIGQVFGSAGFKIDLVMIAAILTVIGYSVNDTIVVFDRIRENRGKLTAVSEQVINTSINQTLGRTLLTSGTTFIVVFIMFVWGGPGIHAFNYALLAGIIFGTYSSIAIASPLLLGFKEAVASKAAKAGDQDQ